MTHATMLIVDGEAVVAEAVKAQLCSFGHRVVGIVSSGQEAIESAGEHRPDMVLMDVQLPGGLDGIETAAIIQAQYGIPVIYLTAAADEETLERARPTLPLAYLIKPFVSSDLQAAVELAWFRHRVSRIAEQRGRRLDAVVRGMADALVMVDRQGTVTELNPAAEVLLGWTQAEAVGKAVEEVLTLLDPDGRGPVMLPIRRVLHLGAAAAPSPRPFILRSRQGVEQRVVERASAIRDEQDLLIGVVTVLRPASDAT